MSSNAMWYKKGNFYDVPTTHINFFLQNPELLGFTQKEKEQLCIQNGLLPDATECPEPSGERVDIMLEVLKRGAIRIRFYGGQTSVQCYDRNNKMCFKELQNCVLDGMNTYFGSILTVMDTKGWGETLNSMGWGTQIKDFVAAALKRRNRQEKIMSRNEQSLNTVFSDRELVYSASYNRMKSYMYEHETIVLTSDKDKRTSDQNYEIEQDFRNQLMNLCSDNGWKVIPVYGGYTGTDDRSSNEHSYMIINMNDSKDFRRKVNEFMRNFDKQFKRDFRQECIIYSPALKDDSVKDGNNRHRFNGKAQFDYPNNRRAKSDNVGMFEDKAKSVYRDDDKIGGYFYTTPRRRNSHSYAFGTEFVDDDKVKKERAK